MQKDFLGEIVGIIYVAAVFRDDLYLFNDIVSVSWKNIYYEANIFSDSN
jgi:hypothetical protein